ncbi:unnamed protein product [Mytilus coruscus]|uniref:C1q domain-containing protein n=1 Tax=Mytilus coruscus TaxID=42192 RepID=A0A6J8ELA5_MYTCO|nr:unnamed protein product [Mytilus coruscus]
MEKNYALLMSKQNISTNDIHYLTTMDDKLEVKIDKMKEKQTLTESRLSRVKSDVIKNTKKGAVSLYPVDQKYTSGSIITFNGIWTSTGINSARLVDIRNKGYFTCDKPGIYLVAISLVTHTTSKTVTLFKNTISMKQISLTHDTIDETTTLTLLLQLNVGDTLSLKAVGDVHIHGYTYSELTILKITT